MSNWYVQTERGEEGPLSTAQLTVRIEHREIQGSDLVRPEGEDAWFPAYHCSELLKAKAPNSGVNHQPVLKPILPWLGGIAVGVLIVLLVGSTSRWAAQWPSSSSASVEQAPSAPDNDPQNDAASRPRTPEDRVPTPSKIIPRTAPPTDALLDIAKLAEFDAPPSDVADDATSSHVTQKVVLDELSQSESPSGPATTTVTVESYAGMPFGVGELKVEFAVNERPQIHPDNTLFVLAQDRRILYPAFDVVYSDTKTHVVSVLVARFLFQGDDELQLSVVADGEQLTDTILATPRQIEILAAKARKSWWELFNDNLDDLPAKERLTQYFFAESLARRMDLAPPSFPSNTQSERSAIEEYFEQAVGLLLGFDSVQLAMQTDVNDRLLNRREVARMSLPAPLQLRSVQVPPVENASLSVESIAKRVPEECFYVRCRTLDNYLWLRDLLMSWGGDLTQAVTFRTANSYTRERIERQLALNPYSARELGLDEHIKDIALIGCDTLFHDGAALGVIIEAADTAAVEQIIAKQRSATMELSTAIREESLTIDGHRLTLLISPHNRVRSYYVVDGPYILVTNSEHIARRFLETGRGYKCLGDLREYRYARSTMGGHDDEATFIYVSDPFFRNIVSPHYRIEMQRRRQAASDLDQLRVAYLAAIAEGVHVESIDDLMERGFLPADFRQRPDGSTPLFQKGRVADSLRGAQSTFLPVPDVKITKVTQSETQAYLSFSQGYRQQWRLMDPVSVSIGRRQLQEQRESVTLDIYITPYAREHYAQLTQYLVSDPRVAITPHDDDLLSINTTLRSQGKDRRLYAGLRDQRVPFELKNGKAEPLDITASTFGRSRFYLAMSPPSTDALRDVGRLLGMRTNMPKWHTPDVSKWTPYDPVGIAAWSILTITDIALPLLQAMETSGRIETNDNWLVMATSASFRKDILATLDERTAFSQPLIRFRMQDIQQAEVYPYVRAYTYVAAREASANNAQRLNNVTQQLSLPADKAMRVVEYLNRETPVCPLDGEYRTQSMPHGPEVWIATSWNAPSRFEETSVPAAYNFQFLEWLKGLHVDFDLDRTTLRAFVEMTVETSEKVDNPAEG